MHFRILGLALCASLTLTACSDIIGPQGSKVATTRETNLIQLAQNIAASGDTKAAEETYRKAIALSNGAVDAHRELADLYIRTGKPDEAESLLKEALKLQPADKETLISLGNLMINQAEPAKALEYLDRAIKAAPNESRAYNSKGVALDAVGKYTDAQAAYRKAIALKPKDAAYVKNNLALSYILAEKYDDAIKLLLPLANSRDARPLYRQNLAMAYGLKGDYGNALALGLKDLNESDAKENIEFYRYLIASKPLKKSALADGKKVETAVTPVAVKALPAPKTLPKPAIAKKPVPAAKAAVKPAAEEEEDEEEEEETPPAPPAKPQPAKKP